jgi:protection-of-telomeres protein 1
MSANAPAKKRSKLCEIKDMGFGEFHDLVGEVVKTYPASFNTLDLYVTDYTTNEDLFLYAEEDDEDLSFMFQKKWPGPKGQMTIAIRLYEPHASFVSNNVHDGDFVYIQNLKTKFSPMNKLEASCQQDQRYPNKIQVHLCTRESQMEPIKKRKEAYEQARGKSGTSGLPAQPKKPSAKAAAKKKQEKKERQRLQRELEEQELKEKLEKIEAGQMNPRSEYESNARAVTVLTSLVRAGHVDIKRSRIADIINNPERTLKTIVGDHELPYLNCKYRIRVRVIDCFPSQISDMTRSKADPEYCEPSLTDTQKEELEDEFEWFFCLLVEDCDAPVGNENNRLMLTIGDTQGQGLLKMDACK